MSNRFVDRKSEFPGRVKLTKVTGSEDLYVLEKQEGNVSGNSGGQSLAEGTPLNAATLNQFEADLKQYTNSAALSKLKIGTTEYNLRISTSGEAGYITFVLEE